MKMRIIMKNGKLLSKKNTYISIFDKSTQYGYGLFETMRTYHQKPFQTEKHIQRLLTGAKELEIKTDFTAKEIEKMIENISFAFFKKYLTKKIENLKIKTILTEKALFIYAEPLTINKKLKNGVSCFSIRQTRALPQYKSLAYLDSFLANQKAKQKGGHDAILINENNLVSEGAYSNLFWFENNILFSPQSRKLPGITAQLVKKISPFPYQEKKITLKELQNKNEVFLTQSLHGIVPITKIDEKIINQGEVGQKTQAVINAFAKESAKLK